MANQYDVRKSILDAGLNYPINTNQMNNAVSNFSALNQGSNFSALPKQAMTSNQAYNIPQQTKGYSSLGNQMNAMNLPMPSGSGQKKVVDNTPPNQKNNLLNYLVSPKGKGMAQGLLEASGYSDTPVTFGQAIGMGLKRGTEAQTAADATAAAQANAQFEKDKFEYEKKNNQTKNWLELQKILAKDNRSAIEKKMAAIHPNLVAGTQEYTDAALELIKSGAINIGGDQKTGWDQLEMGSAENLIGLTTDYQTGFEKANNNNNKLASLRRSIAAIPADQFGKLAETKLFIGSLLQSIGVPIDQQSQAMKETAYALGGEFVMGQIQLTKGAVSEKEMAYFDAISPNITKTKEGMLLMIKLAEHQNSFEKLKNEEYLKFKKTWKEKKDKGLTAGDLETEWGEKLIELTNNQKLPQGIINDMENITLKGSLKEWNEDNNTAPILNPKTDKSYIATQIAGITNTDGDLKYVKDSQQFIGFTEDGRPKYLVEDFEGNFKTIAVTKGTDYE